MKNKTVLITGATSGIGLGIAKHFASAKASVIANGYNAFNTKSESEQLERELIDLGAMNALYHDTDVSNHSAVEEMFDLIYKKFGKIDVLINNAGIQYVSPIEEFPIAKIDAIIKTNLLASFYTIKNVIPAMKQNKWGRIINIASAHALVASPFKSAYVAAKHGLLGLTKTIALETAEYGITVNAICPGYVGTPLVLNQIATTAKLRKITEEEVINKVMLGPQATKKFVEIDEIAALIMFLCSHSACSITGAAISIDGGWTAQ